MSPNSKVWVYQSKKLFNKEEALEIRTQLDQFAQQWTSHNNQLQALAQLHHNRFIVLMVDETHAGASGCSIDKSVHFLKSLEQQYQTDLFDRMHFSYLENDEVVAVDRDEFAAHYEAGKINDETLVFDNLVKTKADFDAKWQVPLGVSWHKRML